MQLKCKLGLASAAWIVGIGTCLAQQSGDPIVDQYVAAKLEEVYKPALEKSSALAREGLAHQGNDLLLAVVPEAKRSPAHNFALGNMLYGSRPDLSEALHRKVVEAEPTSVAAHLEWAMVEQRAGKCANAAPSYRKVIASHPDNVALNALLADCLVQLGQYQKAVDAWKAAEHPRHHSSIEEKICEIYGPLLPSQRRSDLLVRLRKGELGAAEEVIALDLDYNTDWWNSKTNEPALKNDLAEIGKAMGAQSQRFRELKLWADVATGGQKLDAGLKELGLLIPPAGKFPVSSFVARNLIQSALGKSLVDRTQLLKSFEPELRRRALGESANDVDAMKILGHLIYEERKNQLTEIDLAGWKRYHLDDYARSYLIDLQIAGKLSLTSPDLIAAVSDFPKSVGVQRVAFAQALDAGKSPKELVPYIGHYITAEYSEMTGFMAPKDSYRLKNLFAHLEEMLHGHEYSGER